MNTMTYFRHQYKYPILLGIITAVLTALNLLWVKWNNVPIFYDTAGHTVLTYIYAAAIKGDIPLASFVDFLRLSPYYPPFMFIISSIIPLVFGFHYKLSQYWSVLFLPIAVIGVYLYSKEFTKSQWWAFASASFFLFFPHLWEQSRYFMLDLPLTTFLIWSLYFLQFSNLLQKKLPTALFFLMASITQLTKWYASIYLLIPFLFTIHNRLVIEKYKWNWFLKLIPYLVVSFLIFSLWFITNVSFFIQNVSIFARPDFGDPLSKLSFKNLTFYLFLLLNYQIVAWQFLWLIISICLLLSSKLSQKYLLLVQVIAIYGLFTFIGNKNLRYLMPLLPFLAIIMGYGLEKMKTHFKKWAYNFYSGFLVLNFFFYMINSFGWPIQLDWQPTLRFSPQTDLLFIADFSNRAVSYRYQNLDWSPKTVVEDLVSISHQPTTLVLVGANNPYVSVAGLEVFSTGQHLNLFFRDAPFDIRQQLQPADIEAILKKHDYILIPDQYVGPESQINYHNLHAVREYVLAGHTRNLALVKSYDLPNHDKLYLFRYDPAFNQLAVLIQNNYLYLRRSLAAAKVFLQYQTGSGQWFQESLTQTQTEFRTSLKSVKTVRIDYPAHLWQILIDNGWKYDGDKQLGRVMVEK